MNCRSCKKNNGLHLCSFYMIFYLVKLLFVWLFLLKTPPHFGSEYATFGDLLSFWHKLITLSFSKVMYQIYPSQWYLTRLRNKWHSLISFNILFSLIYFSFFNDIRILKCICTGNVTLADEISIVCPKICHIIPEMPYCCAFSFFRLAA